MLWCARAPLVLQGSGVIKPGDTLLFDVELLGFHEKAKEKWEMSAAEIMEEAMKIKVDWMGCFTLGQIRVQSDHNRRF